MKLTGKNFQCWSEFNLSIEGLTVMVGPSNKGKSSLFRALKGVLRNDLPVEFVRDNQEEPLEIEFVVDGTTIKATRSKKGSTKYEINGKKYTSLNGKIPEEVEKLKFGEVKIGEYSIDPIFSEQNKSQFLIDSDRWKPNELNAIIGAFSSTEKLDAGKKEANLRVTQRKSEATALATEIREAEERRGALVDLSEKVAVIVDEVNTSEKRVKKNEILISQLESSLSHRARLEPLNYIIETLTVPDLSEVGTQLELVGALSSAAESLILSRFLGKLVAQLDEISSLWSNFVVVYKQIQGLAVLIEAQVRQTSVENYASRIALNFNGVESEFSSLIELNSRIAYLAGIVSLRDTIQGIKEELSKQDTLLAEAEEELESLKQEEKEQIKSGMCPTCGYPLEHICQLD